MTGVPLAHVGGLPIEETLASFGPALLLALGVARAKLRAGPNREQSVLAPPALAQIVHPVETGARRESPPFAWKEKPGGR